MIQQNKNNLKILSCISGVDFLVNNYRLRLVFDNVSLGVEKYFFIAVLFAFSLSSNVIDLIPYSFTVTSHLIVIFALFFSTFIGKQHYYKRIFLYNNVGDGIVCNSSSDSKSPNGGLDSFNETKFEEMSLKKLRITLENMSAVSLKKLVKYYGIKLRGHRRKAEKISLIMDYFSKRKTASLEDNFEVLANENAKQKGFMISNSFINQREDNFMNISAIFRLDKKKDIASGEILKQQKIFWLS